MSPSPVAIDWHAHVFHSDLPLSPDRRYAPDYDARLGAFLARLDSNDLTHGVLVQPSFLGYDNSYLLACVAAARGRLRGVAALDASTPHDDLQRLGDAGVIGVRLNLIGHVLPDLSHPEFARFVDAIIACGWLIEVQRPAIDLTPFVRRLLARGADVVIDHYGLPDAATPAGQQAFDDLLALGRSDRLWVKISAPYRLGGNCLSGWERAARKAYAGLITAPGPERLLWGSDWPHTQFELTQDFRGNRLFLEDLSPDPAVRARILQNGQKLFRF